MREDGAGKRAKLESDGMRELKSDLGSSFNDLAVTRLTTADLKVKADGVGWMVGGKAGTPIKKRSFLNL